MYICVPLDIIIIGIHIHFTILEENAHCNEMEKKYILETFAFMNYECNICYWTSVIKNKQAYVQYDDPV